jgi:hypothetical protein
MGTCTPLPSDCTIDRLERDSGMYLGGRPRTSETSIRGGITTSERFGFRSRSRVANEDDSGIAWESSQSTDRVDPSMMLRTRRQARLTCNSDHYLRFTPRPDMRELRSAVEREPNPGRGYLEPHEGGGSASSDEPGEPGRCHPTRTATKQVHQPTSHAKARARASSHHQQHRCTFEACIMFRQSATSSCH